MARLTWTGWLGVVGLCLMLTLAVMPKTKWIVKLHRYAATGSIHLNAGTGDVPYDDLLELIRPETPKNPKEELAIYLCTKAVPDGDARRERLAQLSEKYPNDALIQAAACRYLSMVTIPRPDKNGNIVPPKMPAEYQAKRQRFYALLVEVANRGIAADPDNLYFDLILACTKVGQQKIDEARQIVRRASMKQSYNEYNWDECNLLVDLMKGPNDNGAYMRMQVYAGLVLPYYSNMKPLSICLMQSGSDEQKRQSSIDLMLVANTVSQKADTLIGILVMRAVTSIAIVNTFHHEKGAKPTDSQYLAAIDALQPLADARYEKGSSPNLRTIYNQSNRLEQAIKEYSDENHKKVLSNDPTAYPLSPFAKMKLSLGFLLAVVFLIPAALMQFLGQKLRKHAGAARALPLLVPMFIALLTQELSEVLTGPNYASLMALSMAGLIVAFLIAWFERLAKVSFWIAMVVSAAGLLYGAFVAIVGYTPFSWTLLLAIATVTVVFVSRDIGPRWVRTVLSGLLIMAAACSASLNLALSPIKNMEWIISIVFLVLAATVGPVRPNAGRRIVGPCILAASVVFALFCRQMVAIDQRADLMTQTFKTEVQQVREMAAKMP